MANNVQTEESTNMTALVQGIINDAQQLIRQEISLARSELRQEWDKTKAAVMSMATGGVIAFVGVFLLAFGLVRLLHWATGGVDSAAVPLWGWFLIVGGVFAFIGVSLLYMGLHKASEIQVPPPQTTNSLKEIL
jgi:sterol desaturase/sphingolipid hydroxylase (fatty acid hydroxylase superfamily)